MELILQGSLKHFRLSEMLNFFHREGKSGTLRMVSSGREALFYLDGGSIVFAKSNQDQFGLGILLLRKKKINRGQRDSLEDLMLHEGEKYAQAAVKKNVF